MRTLVAQFYATIIGNFLALSSGIAFGWPSSNIPRLQSDETPLASGPLSIHEISWVSSVLYISGMVGAPCFGLIASNFGRKVALYVVSLPILSSWILILTGSSVYHLYFARMMAGLGAAGSYVVMPLIVSEIADNRIRGALGSIMILSNNGGIIVGFIICGYLDYYVVPWIPITFVLIFWIGFSFVPDTPKYLRMKNKLTEAEKASKFYQTNVKDSENSETLKLYPGIEHKTKLTAKDFCNRSTRKGILIAILVLGIACFSGPFTLTNYYGSIFRQSGSSLSSDASTVIVGTAQLLGALSTTIFADRLGRKPLLLVSAYGCACCLASMGFFMFLLKSGVDLTSFTWLPIVIFSTLVFLAGQGATTLPYVIVGEIFAQKVRAILIALSSAQSWTMNFISIKLFPYLVQYLGMYGALWTYTAILTTYVTTIAIVLPETKGKSIEEITDMLSG